MRWEECKQKDENIELHFYSRSGVPEAHEKGLGDLRCFKDCLEGLSEPEDCV